MAKRAYKWTWQARIQPETLTSLRALADELGFRVSTPGKYEGTGSAPTLLDSLAAAYDRDPAAVRLALKVLGVVAEPTADDVRFSSESEDVAGSVGMSGELTTKLIRGSDSE